MTPEEEKRAMRVYLPLMDEIVARINVYNICVDNESKFAPGLVRELCYLQFRAICELVALGCMAVYGDRKLSRKVIAAYEAPKLIHELQRLDPDCYPQPASIVKVGKEVRITGRSEINHLSRSDLIKLWKKAGDILHRAPYSKLIREPDPKLLDLSDVGVWARKIVALLNTHLIPLGPTALMTVVLRDVETGLPSANILRLSLDDGTASATRHRVWKHIRGGRTHQANQARDSGRSLFAFREGKD
jgi:hypothetical protein